MRATSPRTRVDPLLLLAVAAPDLGIALVLVIAAALPETIGVGATAGLALLTLATSIAGAHWAHAAALRREKRAWHAGTS